MILHINFAKNLIIIIILNLKWFKTEMIEILVENKQKGEIRQRVLLYIFHLINAEVSHPLLEVFVYITLQTELKSIPSFLFWRAFLLIQSK